MPRHESPRMASIAGLRRRGVARRERHDEAAAAVWVSGLSAGYDGEATLVDVSFELHAGERLAVVGPNGAGKSTLLMALAGLIEPMAGDVRIHGHGPCSHICIAYVPQRNSLDWRFPMTLADFVMLGRVQRIGFLRRPRAHDRARVAEALDAVGLASMAERRIEALSGGQQQRLFIARALAQQAEVALFDEPLAGLDVHTHREVLELISGLSERSVTVILSLHDLALAAARFDKILLLRRAMLAFGTPQDVLVEGVLRQAYGSCLHVVAGENGGFLVHDTACSGGDP